MSQSKGKRPTGMFTENWLPVRRIKDGVILLANKEMVTGVKIEPRNIFILEPAQQGSIIDALKSFYNTLDFEWWLVCADRPVDLSVYQAQLELAYNQQQDPSRRKIISEDLSKINLFINNQVVDTEFFVLFKEKSVENINEKLRRLINGFANASLSASKTSDNDLRVLLDNFLNGGTRTDFRTVVTK